MFRTSEEQPTCRSAVGRLVCSTPPSVKRPPHLKPTAISGVLKCLSWFVSHPELTLGSGRVCVYAVVPSALETHTHTCDVVQSKVPLSVWKNVTTIAFHKQVNGIILTLIICIIACHMSSAPSVSEACWGWWVWRSAAGNHTSFHQRAEGQLRLLEQTWRLHIRIVNSCTFHIYTVTGRKPNPYLSCFVDVLFRNVKQRSEDWVGMLNTGHPS